MQLGFIKRIVGGIIILSLLFAFTSCGFDEHALDDTLSGGFDSVGGCESPAFKAAFECDKRVFNIDDVTLTFYYGHGFGNDEDYLEHYRKGGLDYPKFDLFFMNEDDSYLIRHVDENFISAKYGCNKFSDGSWVLVYSEIITIPKDLFTKEKGCVNFSIRGFNSSHQEDELLCTIGLYYVKTDNTVTLYNYMEYHQLGLDK